MNNLAIAIRAVIKHELGEDYKRKDIKKYLMDAVDIIQDTINLLVLQEPLEERLEEIDEILKEHQCGFTALLYAKMCEQTDLILIKEFCNAIEYHVQTDSVDMSAFPNVETILAEGLAESMSLLLESLEPRTDNKRNWMWS